MEKITRNVRDLEEQERRVYEAALGEPLRENQQVILQVVTLEAPERQHTELPDWCNVYEGLTDEEIEEIEQVILDRNGWTRDF